jgi:hypothetical protein
VDLEGFDDLVADGEHRVQGGLGVLENHADAVPADLLELGFGLVQQIFSLEVNSPVDDASGRIDEPRMEKPVMDLPAPDSPTRPRIRPRSSEKLTPATALTTPLRVKK